MKNPDGVLFSMPRETERKVQKILEISQKRIPRETESTRVKNQLRHDERISEISVNSETAYFDMDAIYGFIDAGSIAHGPVLRKENGIIQKF